jgi:Fe-S oxidoreductase
MSELINSEIDKIIEQCIECNLCIEECKFLQHVCQTPAELAERLKGGEFREKPRIPYCCNICNLCQEICPWDLNIGKMCLELRQQLVEEGLAPLPAHKKFVEKEQERLLSDSFTLVLPDPATKECQRAFFPGCNLSGYAPSLVIKTYDYLRQKLPGTGIIMGCCGAPTQELGKETEFQEILSQLESAVRSLGAFELIVACPYCYYTLKHYAPQLKLKSVYELLAEIGLPAGLKKQDWTFSLHDSCRARWEKDLQDSVRTLTSMMGYRISEMEYSRDKARCCGAGGVITFADFNLARNVTKQRAGEAHFDILTYCAACRETLAREKPVIHILDLIFNPDWEKDRLKPPNKAPATKENQSLLKSQLEER